MRGAIPERKVPQAKATTEQSSGSADQPRYREERPQAVDWNKLTIAKLKDELRVRGFTKSTNPDGSKMKKADYVREIQKLT